MVAERSFLHTLKALAKLERGELQQIASRSNKIICMEKNNLWPAEENMKDIYIQTHEVVISVVFCKILLVVFQNMSDVKGIRTYCFVFIKDGTSIFCLPFCVCVCVRFQKSIICHALILVFLLFADIERGTNWMGVKYV